MQAIGACYIPLDPMYPAQRLSIIIADAKPKWVIDTDAVALSCELSEQCQRLVLDDPEMQKVLSGCSKALYQTRRSSSDLAIYFSLSF